MKTYQIHRKILWATFLLFMLPFSNYAQITDILVTSFETNSLGTIHNQGNWVVDNGAAVVTDTVNFSGSRSLNFIAENQSLVVSNSTYSGSEQGVSGIVYIDFYIKIQSMVEKDFAISGYDLFGGSSKRAFVCEFDTPSGTSGVFRIYEGSSKLNIGTYNVNEWNRISARIDYDNEIYQVIFNGSDAVSAVFRETYTPTSSGNRAADIKEYHELRFNLGYNGAVGSVDAVVDDIYVSTNPIADIEFPMTDITYTIALEQPEIGSIAINPELAEYPDSTEVTVSLNLPEGYENAGWTGDLFGTEHEKTFRVVKNMHIGATVEIDKTNPPVQYAVTVNQPEFGEVLLAPTGGIYYDYATVTAKLNLPVGYINAGWTGDLSGTDLQKSFIVKKNMQIGANVIIDDTPPTVYPVSSASDLKNICKGHNLKPGDIVEVADGLYNAGGITIESSGTPNKPIIIRAQNTGAAELTGSTYLTFRKNAHIHLQGFTITSSIYTVIKLEACNNIRISHNIFRLTESEGNNGKWVYIGGYWDDSSLQSHHNRIDHNIFRDKHQLGNFITIDGGDNVSQYDQIDHNYFYNIGPRHANEMEAIRVGWSELSLTDGFTIIEHNLFEACDGDPEIISVKSCKDTVRYNTFRQCMGTVSLRHGDGSVIHNNFFLGDGKIGTGGLRIYARDHLIYNNYFEGLMGSKWDAALTLTNGDTDTGSLSAHWRINNVIISHNTLVNNYANIEIGYPKADNSWKKEPRNVTLANNLVIGGETDLINIMTVPTEFTWNGNIMYPENGVNLGIEAMEDQIQLTDPRLVFEDSLWLLSAASPAIDAANNSYIDIFEDIQGQPRATINDVGADEYSAAAITRMPLKPENVGPYGQNTVSIPTPVKKSNDSFVLLRNYPNPFNPSTTLEYSLKNNTNVSIIIYNMLGQKITELINERQSAGRYQIKWQADNIPAGVYVAVLTTNSGIKSRKLLLLK